MQYNPVLGETHFLVADAAWLLVEQARAAAAAARATRMPRLLISRRDQVSHQPPVTAFYLHCPGGATLAGSELARPYFTGLAIDIAREGLWALTMPAHGEMYRLNAPTLSLRLLPLPGVEWTGAVNVSCDGSPLAATLDFYPRTMFNMQQHGVGGDVRRARAGA